MIKNFCGIVLLFLLCSCASKKDIVYFQNINSLQESEEKPYEPIIQQNDLLSIFVTSSTPEAVKNFNMIAVGFLDNFENPLNNQVRFQTYLVDVNGDIQFPVIGRIKLGGLTRTEALAKMNDELSKYVKDPVVTLRITNYKISVFGEVLRPGSYTAISERITLPEALSLAGDLTIYGDRKQVLIIREVEGKKTYNYVDITKADFINSPFYYLTQNDVVYVSPNQTKVNASVVGSNTTVIISSVSLLITVVALIIR